MSRVGVARNAVSMALRVRQRAGLGLSAPVNPFDLEEQCVEFDPRRPSDGQRCDRMDALVWGLLALSEEAPAGQWQTLDDADVWDLAGALG